MQNNVMKILVCVKQVPDAESRPLIAGTDLPCIREEGIVFRMNRYDEYALEEALLLKEKYPGTVVDVISVGPERALAVLKKGLEKGADRALLIKCDGNRPGAYETASLIAGYAKDKNYSLIFAGVMSEDLMQCQVGPMVASFLSIPCAVSVVKISVNSGMMSVTVDSELEGVMAETVKIGMPCLLTFQTGVNQPRYPSLTNVMRARGMSPELINDAGAGAAGLNQVTSLSYPPADIKGTTIEGNTGEKAARLADILHEKGLI